MKITLRLNEPVTQTKHQKYILGAAMRDVADSLMLFSDAGELYLHENPFTFNAEGTVVEGEIAVTVPEKNMNKFKLLAIESMNAGFAGNTTKAYEPAQDFPKIKVKVMDVENDRRLGR